VWKQKFEATHQLWHDNFLEARHRLQRLVNAGVIRRSQATIVRMKENGNVLIPVYPAVSSRSPVRLTS
jgi:hypothetical protein